MLILDCTILADSKGPARLPAVAALSGFIEDMLVPAESVNAPEGPRVEDVPGAGDVEAPLGVDVALFVDDNVGRPFAADLGNPAGGVFGVGVGDGDEVDVFVGFGEGGEGFECFFGDCVILAGMDMGEFGVEEGSRDRGWRGLEG